MARRVFVQLSLAGLVAGAAFSTSSTLKAQGSDNWLVSESGATGDADLKLDVAAAKRALGDGASPADTQKRMTKAMGELLRSQPGKNRLFDASNAPAEAVDVTNVFVELVGDQRVESPSEAKFQQPQHPQGPDAPRAQARARTERPIIVTAQRAEPLVVPQQLALNGIGILNLSLEHIAAIVALPFHHRDPFDRLLVV